MRVFRFAPTPNGYLHLGHALSALINADMARASQGKLLLRIEDIDTTRCRPEFEHAIYEDLAWLGIVWARPVRRQSEHFVDYRGALARLDKKGLIYPSFESRAELARHATGRDPDGGPRVAGGALKRSAAERVERLARGDPYALRLDMDAALASLGPRSWPEGDPRLWGDVVLARKDTPTSYHLAVVVDDALQGVSDVVRGEDLLSSTSVHRVLQALLDLPTPRYHHHPLIRGADGRKLAKSSGSTALRELRATGLTPSDIRARVGL